MKRLAVFFLSFAVLAVLCAIPAAAEAAAQVPEELLAPFSELPSAIRSFLPEDVTDTEAIAESVGFTRLFALAAEAFTGAFSSLGGFFLRLFGITLLFSAASACGKGAVVQTVFPGAAALALWGTLSEGWTRVAEFLSDLSSFTATAQGIYTALFATAGSTATAASAGLGFSAFLTVVEVFSSGLLLPLLEILFALSAVSAVGAPDAVGEVADNLRGFTVFLLSLTAALLTASLAFQTSLAGSTDSVAARTVRFAVGTAIPVVGGSVSGALGTLCASLSLVRSAAGSASVVVLLALVLPVIAELFLRRFALSLAQSLSRMLGAPAIGGVFCRFRGLYDLLIAAVAILALTFLLYVGVLSGGVTAFSSAAFTA